MKKRQLPLKSLVSVNVRAMRMRSELTQQELADRAGLHVRYISRLENTPQNITLEILEKVARGLGQSVVRLVSERETHPTSQAGIESLDRALQLLTSFRARVHPKK